MTTVAQPPLEALASETGVLSVLALDHRDAMRNAFARAGQPNVPSHVMLQMKEQIVEALADRASAVMLDPGAVPSCRPAGKGLVVPLEAQGHLPLAGGRLTPLAEAFGPAEAAKLGADGCKLLLYYRADHIATAERQRALLERVAADCHRHGLPLVVEPLVYRLEGEDETRYQGAFGTLVVAAARQLADAGADLLKLQFPGDARRCKRLTDAAAPLPWVLLGGSDVSADRFAVQLELSCCAGASGFMAGRAIWSEALALPPERQRDWLRRDARARFERLTDIAEQHARRIR